ncbi:MAG: TadE family protein, partial [Cyanobacteria bacterium P01_H01_bin.74]
MQSKKIKMEKMFQNIPFKLLVRVKFYFGQSLQEFIIVLPILIFIVVAGTNFALGVHKAHMLSDASHWIASQKFRLADNDNSVGQVELRSLINSSSGVSDTLTRRDFIDQIRFNSIDRYFTIIEASTEQNALSNFVNGFEFKTSQVINRPLLLATSAGGPSRRLN